MTRTTYAKRMADGGSTDDAVLAQAPKSEYVAADIEKQNDQALKDAKVINEKSRFSKFRDHMATGSVKGGGGFIGGLTSGMTMGAKAKNAWDAKADGGAVRGYRK